MAKILKCCVKMKILLAVRNDFIEILFGEFNYHDEDVLIK